MFALSHEIYSFTVLLASANFKKAQISYADFQRTTCIATSFDNADLFKSTFRGANVKHTSFYGANLTNVDFSGANLYKVDFTNTKVTGSQLQNALSIQDVKLPDGTLAIDANLIKNDQADCNISVVNSWTLEKGNITTLRSDTNSTDCWFTLQSLATGAAMLQRVDLSKKWDSNTWSYSQAILTARMSTGVTIQLRGISSSNIILARETLSKFQYASTDCRTSFVFRTA